MQIHYIFVNLYSCSKPFMNAAVDEEIKSDENLLIKTLCSALLVSFLAVSEGFWVFGLLFDRV